MIKSIKVWLDLQNSLLDFKGVESIVTHKVNDLKVSIAEIPDAAYKETSQDEFSTSALRAYLKDRTTEEYLIILTCRNIDDTLIFTNSIIVKQVMTLDNQISFDEKLVAQLIFVSYCILNNPKDISYNKNTINNKLISISSLNFFTSYSNLLSKEDTNILGRITYEPPPPAIFVLITHGIRTHAEWSKPAENMLKEYNIASETSKYDWVDTIKFAFILWVRKKYAKKFLKDIISEKKNHPDARFCISVHSYGSVVLIEALKLANELKINLTIDSIILSGSILPTDFDWQEYISFDNRYVSVGRVLNICGSRDIWPVIANYFVRGDVGYSGTFGLNGSNNVTDIIIGGKTHASILEKEQIESVWVQYLKKGKINTKGYDGERSKLVTNLDYILKILKYPIYAIFFTTLFYGLLTLMSFAHIIYLKLPDLLAIIRNMTGF